MIVIVTVISLWVATLAASHQSKSNGRLTNPVWIMLASCLPPVVKLLQRGFEGILVLAVLLAASC